MNQESERGAVAVIVAILLIVLLGFAAIAVDVGMLYAERAQLRNGADAAALGIAQSCADESSDTNEMCSEEVSSGSLAKDLADANALDGLSNASSVVLDETAGTVAVTTDVLEDGSTPNSMSLFFARALGFDEAEVSVTSHAAWGVPVGGLAPFAIAFSKCEVDAGNHGDGTLQFLTAHGADGSGGGCTGPSGHELPGGFGWLNQTPGHSCGVIVNPSDSWIDSETGNNTKEGCSGRLSEWKSELQAGKPLVELIPVFDDTNRLGGSNGKFRIVAFAAFEIYGWSFPGTGNEYMTPAAAKYYKDNKLTSSNRGFIGKFLKYESLDTSFQIKPMPDGGYGAEVVKLTLGVTP